MATRVTAMVKAYLAPRNVNITVFDPLEKTYLQTVHQPVHFYRSDPPAELVADLEIVQKSDAYVCICGEYNRCIPPAMATLIDHFPPKAFAAKPVASVTYSMGRGGGVCSAMQLRTFLAELSMVPVSPTVNIGLVQNAISESGELKDDSFNGQLQRTFDQMFWYANVLKKARNSDEPFPN